MRKILFFLSQTIILLVLLLILNGVAWVFIHLRDDATFLEANKWASWESLPVFNNKKFARELWNENQQIKSEYMSFTAWKQTTFQGKYIKTNKDGERNDISEYSEKSYRVTPKIRLFGGSTMWGVGASDDSTIAAFLQKLNASNVVYNHGIQGFNSRQNLDRLITLYQLGKQADIVVFYDGVNEMSMCAKTISLPGHYQEDLFKQKVTNRNTVITPIDIFKEGIYKALLRNTIEITQRLHQKLFGNKKKVACSDGYICKCDIERTQNIARMLIENWKLSKAIVESKGGKFIAILQPVFSEGKSNISYLNAEKNANLIDFKENYQSLYKEIKKEIKKNNYEWIYDFTNVLDDNNAHYLDYCHVNSSANAIIAKRINDIIINTKL